MSHSWTFDAPTGVYKNHSLSGKIRMASIAKCIGMQFVGSDEDGSGMKKGADVTITRVSNISAPTSDILVEEDVIPEDSLSLSTQAVAVYERGRAIPYTGLSVDLAHFDLANAIQRKLRDQLALSFDAAIFTAFKAGQVKAIPTGVSALTFDTDGTASSAAVANVNMYHMEQIRDYMFSTLNIDPMDDGEYVMALATKGCRGIKTDPAWIDWKKYTTPEAKYNAEIGKIENIRVVECNNTASLSGSKGTGSVLGEGVCFGVDAIAMATVRDPELRAKESGDYGRSKGVAWYGIYGFDQIWKDSASAGEARVVHVTSS